MGGVHSKQRHDARLLGLSKNPRLVNAFARPLQIQGRFTKEIGKALQDVLEPQAERVVFECLNFLCMDMRCGADRRHHDTAIPMWRAF